MATTLLRSDLIQPAPGARRALTRSSLRRLPVERAARNEAACEAYRACSEIAGPLQATTRSERPVSFRRVASRRTMWMLALMVVANALVGLVFVGWLLLPEHVPGPGIAAGWQLTVARISFGLVVLLELIRLGQNVAMWVFASNMKNPVPMVAPEGSRVAVITTIVPSKEPVEMVAQTLKAMQEIVYRGMVDVWILDEGDDPAVKAMAARLGVRHFTRKGRPEYNQQAGAFRAKTKAGNHNAWRTEHEHDYDFVAQMDPDHVPMPCFLERSLGYFRDPNVAFVVSPQVYGNMYDNWVVYGASQQQYPFSAVVERGGNGMGAPLLIGTNHLYRTTAWRQIGGYQDSVIEDHLTSMRVQGTTNPATGRNWAGVFTPDVLAIGEGPTSWTDYFNQQKRWAYGIWQIRLSRRMRAGIELRPRQRLFYALVQSYYPSVTVRLLLGGVATAVYLSLGIRGVSFNGSVWFTLWSLNLLGWVVLWQWLRRFNLASHERREINVAGLLLAMFAGPVYAAAGVAAVLRRPLAYAVTAKGVLRSAETLSTFRAHLVWAAFVSTTLLIGVASGYGAASQRVWAAIAILIALSPPLLLLFSRLASRNTRQGDLSRAAGARDRRARYRFNSLLGIKSPTGGPLPTSRRSFAVGCDRQAASLKNHGSRQANHAGRALAVTSLVGCALAATVLIGGAVNSGLGARIALGQKLTAAPPVRLARGRAISRNPRTSLIANGSQPRLVLGASVAPPTRTLHAQPLDRTVASPSFFVGA